MLVYGDRSRVESAREKLDAIRERLARDDWLGALIEAGELAQGIADAEFHARSCDARSPAQDAAMRMLVNLARGVRPERPVLDLPTEIETRQAEGFAFYALYPECYAVAARALRGRRVRVIGLRSIGTVLAAVVAAELDAPLPVTVRPVGHPFRRELRLAPELERELTSDRECEFAIVDEGPGLSGSSFGAVADFLEDRGVAPERIHFFPGHLGELGPQASARHRARWARAQRHVASFEDVVQPRLANGFEDLIGPALEPLRDLSGGGWRRLRFASAGDWPPSHVQQERQKLLLRTRDGPWLLKFAGLGREGERKLARARKLERSRFGPEVAGLRMGFLAQRWLGDASHLDISRREILQHVGDYLAFRAEAFPAARGSGATLETLLEMALHNGGEAAASLERWRPELPRLERLVRRLEIDGRMHAWEWLQLGPRILKADAVDHCAAHDLVGCQDIAWDIVGGDVELGLDAGALAKRLGVDRELLGFYRPCYLAFQLGYWTLAADAAGPDGARERTWASRYAALLSRPRASRTRRRP